MFQDYLYKYFLENWVLIKKRGTTFMFAFVSGLLTELRNNRNETMFVFIRTPKIEKKSSNVFKMFLNWSS